MRVWLLEDGKTIHDGAQVIGVFATEEAAKAKAEAYYGTRSEFYAERPGEWVTDTEVWGVRDGPVLIHADTNYGWFIVRAVEVEGSDG